MWKLIERTTALRSELSLLTMVCDKGDGLQLDFKDEYR